VKADVGLDALGDRTRRQILGRLAHGAASVGELAEGLPVGRPAVSMHLRVLRDAGLVTARAEGTRRLYQLDPDALAALRDYLDWYWAQALETFKRHVAAAGDTPMEPEVKVTKSIVVDVVPARAFELFIDLGHWWPLATHNIADPAGETVVLEPSVGGRWYERSRDGGETEWGRVLAFDPPHRILLSWLMGSDWKHEPDPTRASEIEVTFIGDGADRTRVVFEHRHLERYRERADRMRAVLDRPDGAEGVLRAFGTAVAAQAFRNPMINIYSRDIARLASFYERLGFRETFRTPKEGAPKHVEVGLDDFTIGIASVDAAAADHGLSPEPGGRPIEIVLWTDDVDRDHRRLTADGVPALSPPHDFLDGALRAAWVADPDGNPIQFVQRRPSRRTT